MSYEHVKEVRIECFHECNKLNCLLHGSANFLQIPFPICGIK